MTSCMLVPPHIQLVPLSCFSPLHPKHPECTVSYMILASAHKISVGSVFSKSAPAFRVTGNIIQLFLIVASLSSVTIFCCQMCFFFPLFVFSWHDPKCSSLTCISGLKQSEHERVEKHPSNVESTHLTPVMELDSLPSSISTQRTCEWTNTVPTCLRDAAVVLLEELAPIILPPWLVSFLHFLVLSFGCEGSGLRKSIRAISPYRTVASMRGST